MRVAHPLAALATALLVVAACYKGSGDLEDQSGEKLYGTYCAACHGTNGRGFMNLGSSLEGVRGYWDEERLLRYIEDPKAYAADDPRLGAREMAGIDPALPQAARKKIVAYAYSLMD